MAVKVDYYALLEIPRNADGELITTAYKGKYREWRKATNSPDLSRRQEAETWMARLREANEILNDSARRQQYDRELNTQGVEQATAAPRGEGTIDWVEEARGALSRGDYHSAAYAAREATHTIGNSAQSWMLRARASSGLGQDRDALYEARQATQIAANDPEAHFQLGMVQEKLRDFGDALTTYQTCMRLDPSAPQYLVAVANIMSNNGELGNAIALMKSNLERFAGQPIVGDYYALLLIQKAESTPKFSGRGRYMITQASEIAEIKPLIAEARHYNSDQETAKHIDGIEQFLARAEEKVFSVPADGLLGAAGIVLSPLIVLIVAGMLDMLFLGFVLAIAAGVIVYLVCWVPRYKSNDRDVLAKAAISR
ncbi:DnaJ domain-containing protein [Rhodococcus sp. IEGM 1408]|uniref:DnaJ domain-containing protein n=1 Tax=Rhodococcus sp. IEGM 1408 TaxID=3082220 RepID=UPI002955A555|nr:DnaJ domain-containing protein [Rhodococcus sp. IEGM 1408]MDV8002999.1 DnaJ domain-containing protein [Rhodococcus sp. IEGM 1408]